MNPTPYPLRRIASILPAILLALPACGGELGSDFADTTRVAAQNLLHEESEAPDTCTDNDDGTVTCTFEPIKGVTTCTHTFDPHGEFPMGPPAIDCEGEWGTYSCTETESQTTCTLELVDGGG